MPPPPPAAARRVGEPQDIAEPVLLLARPRAAYVDGAELVVDGGLASMLMERVPRPGFHDAAGAAGNPHPQGDRV